MTEKKPDDSLVWAGFWLVGIPAFIAGGPIAGLIGAAAGTVLGGMRTPDPEKPKSYRMDGTFSGQIKEEE